MKDLSEILELFEREGFKLCGSRRMAQKYPNKVRLTKEDTDYDFYTEFTEDAEVMLQELGFEEKNLDKVHYYKDSLLVSLWKHPKLNVDVILRHNADLYCRAFESISEQQYVSFMWKSSPYLVKKFNRYEVSQFLNRLFKALCVEGEAYQYFGEITPKNVAINSKALAAAQNTKGYNNNQWSLANAPMLFGIQPF